MLNKVYVLFIAALLLVGCRCGNAEEWNDPDRISTIIEIAGILGMLFSGWATDRWLKGRAHRTCVFCMAGAALFVFAFWQLPSDAPIWLLFATLCAAGFCIYGPQALIGIAAANQATKKAASARPISAR